MRASTPLPTIIALDLCGPVAGIAQGAPGKPVTVTDLDRSAIIAASVQHVARDRRIASVLASCGTGSSVLSPQPVRLLQDQRALSPERSPTRPLSALSFVLLGFCLVLGALRLKNRGTAAPQGRGVPA